MTKDLAAVERPILHDSEVVDLVEALVGKAINPGQLWLIPLAQDHRPTRMVIPVSGIPYLPEPQVIDTLVEVAAATLGEHGVGSVIYVVERPLPTRVTVADREWAAAIHDSTERQGGVPVRLVCLSHSRGVLPI